MVYRVYVEKKAELANEARALQHDLRAFLGIRSLTGLRLYNRYDLEGISRELFDYTVKTVLSEPQLDLVTDQVPQGDAVFAVEYLPGQFDQRADSAAQCIQILSQGERPAVRTARVYALEGVLTPQELEAVKQYVINPVESREASLDLPETLRMEYTVPTSVRTITGFTAMDAAGLDALREDLGLAMDLDDLKFLQAYFRDEERRDPTITEIRVVDTYWSDHCRHTTFSTHLDRVEIHDEAIEAAVKMSVRYINDRYLPDKAISIIQFKLEAAMIDSRPEWHMQERKQLEHIDFERKVFVRDGKEYAMRDCYFPTIDPKSPYRLTAEEQELVNKLHHSFSVSDKLNKHIQCLFSHGCMYGIFNSNLLFHASVPLNADGSLKEVDINGEKVKGRALLDKIGLVLRSAFNSDTEPKERKFAVDYFWYLWCGVDSPLFDKSKMTTFERYFLEDKTTHTEEKGYYYRLRDDEKVCDMILDSFGVTGQHRHIINGHVPVRVGRGETPIKANGKLMVIDGGFAKAYHNTTGIAGYTLVFHSRGFQLVQHEPFTSAEEAIKNGTDIVSTTQIVEMSTQRMMVRDTDKGAELESQIEELKELLYAYRHGFIKESTKNKFRY